MGLFDKLKLQLAGKLIRSLSTEWQPWDDHWFHELGLKSFAGVTVTADTAMRTSAVYACVRLISEAMGSLPASILQELSDTERAVAKSHPVHRLIHKSPNEAMTPAVYKTVTTAHWALRGQAFSYIYRDGYGTPISILPLHPANVRFEKSKRDGFPDYFVRVEGGEFSPVERKNIAHYRLLTDDGFTGLGPLQLARDQIGAARAADEFSGRFYANDATPRGALQFPKDIKIQGQKGEDGQKIKEKIRDDFMRMVTGENRHKPPVFDQGLEWKAIGISPQDAQMIETRQFNVTDIARIFRVPPHMIADVTNTTSWGTGIEQMSIGFVVYTLMPWIVSMEQEIGRVLISEDDYYCKFNVRGLLRGDLKTEMEAFQMAILTGQHSVNEIRAFRDENPVAGGDTHWRQLNLAPLDAPYDPQAGSRVTVAPERRQQSAGEFVTVEEAQDLIAGVNGNGHRG